MIILVIGRKGQGKSTLALSLAEQVQQKTDAHVIAIFDPKYTYKSIPHTSDPDVFSEMLERGGVRAIAYRPAPAGSGEDRGGDAMAAEFAAFMDAISIEAHLGREQNASRKNLGPVVLVLDEVWFLQSGNTIDPRLDMLIRLSDSKMLYLILAAHRPTDFSPRVRAQADEIYFFQQILPGDLQAIRDLCGDAIAERVATLPKHHVLRYSVPDNASEVWDDPQAWYIEISANNFVSVPA